MNLVRIYVYSWPCTIPGTDMKLTILQVGENPPQLRDRFPRYSNNFERMFSAAGAEFEFETVYVLDAEPLPDPNQTEGVVITGSAAGVYDTPDWMDPLRGFIRRAYALNTPMLGVCFGHQVMADALGGDVRKSDKGWGVGRHVYAVKDRPDFLGDIGDTLAIAASHQDQVISPPAEADVFLSSEFTPNAGLAYRNGAAVSIQPHPEFEPDYSRALVELRRDNPLSDDEVDAGHKSLDAPLDNLQVAVALARFFQSRR